MTAEQALQPISHFDYVSLLQLLYRFLYLSGQVALAVSGEGSFREAEAGRYGLQAGTASYQQAIQLAPFRVLAGGTFLRHSGFSFCGFG
jgi:hypothetical protein